ATYTDLSIHTFVSFILSKHPRVLLASYTWGNDATKYGQFNEKERLREVPLLTMELEILMGAIM
ncbi:23374_t:CDS:2, partial [Gigaspora rosea]